MPDEDTVEGLTRATIKFIVAVVGLILLRAMIVLLPGGNRPVPGTDIELESVLVALVMVLFAGVILYFGYQSSTALRDLSYSTAELRRAGSRVIIGLSVFVALVTVYNGLNPLVDAAIADESVVLFAFDAVFLTAALLVLLGLGYTVLQHLDPFIDGVVTSVSGGDGGSKNPEQNGSGGDGSDTGLITCANCGSNYQQEAAFCADCGTSLSGGAD